MFLNDVTEFGQCGPTDPELEAGTGHTENNVKFCYNFFNTRVEDSGVVSEDRRKITMKGFAGLYQFDWMTEEDLRFSIETESDPISAPPGHYTVQPGQQGRLVWITGPPGLGKSTSAQLLSREKGKYFCLY